jgi:predicted nucleic acid-binding protein
VSFIIDNSVVCAWLITEQSTPYSIAVKSKLLDAKAFAPPLLPLEYSNVLRTGCKRGRIDAGKAQALISAVSNLPIVIEAVSASASEIFALSIRYDLSSYDASYLALALQLMLPIATQDEALMQAARVTGVGVVLG